MAKKAVKNQWRIASGLFKSDPNKKTWGRIGEVASRFTYQLPQTVLGFGYANFENITGNVDQVHFKYGATVVQGNHSSLFLGMGGSAVTLGSYIVGNKNLTPDPNNDLFQHEYGHYLQSQAMGYTYLGVVGYPSLFSGTSRYLNHDYHLVELDANRRAFLYFNKNVDGFYDITPGDGNGWDFDANPLAHYNPLNGATVIIDYKNPQDINRLNDIKLKPSIGDFLMPGAPSGIANILLHWDFK